MAHLLVVRDPDPGRRAGAAAAARRCLEQEHRLVVHSLDLGSVTVVWGSGGGLTVDHVMTAEGAGVLIGDAIPGPGPERITAADWVRGIRREDPAVCDGLHIGIAISAEGTLVIGADLLGILPVYHTTPRPDVMLVATAPGLLRSHPSFQEALDPLGLTGLLLTNSIIDGLTVLRGVRRLSPGYLLQATPGATPVEHLHYRFPVSTIHHDQPLEEWAFRLHEALAAACRRHVVPGIPHSLLLSGGLDSRLLAGVLARQGSTMTAVTLGLATDNDYRCAREVARHLGLPHRLLSPGDGTWDDYRRALRWRGVTNGIGLGADTLAGELGAIHPRALSGYLMDAVVGGSHMYWCYSHADHTCDFDRFFHKLNLHAFPVDVLRRLLRPDVFGDSVDEMLQRVRRRYMEEGDSELERAWRFDLAHRQRFQVGGFLVRQEEKVSPSTPHIDREVLATAGGIPLGVLGGRHIEREMVIRFHPDLARLPLDRGSEDTTPLNPDVRGILKSVPGRVARMAAGRMGLRLRERRYYRRTLAMDRTGWRPIREEIEKFRPAAHEIFDAATFDALVPPPDQPWGEDLRGAEAVGRRLLLNATTWVGGLA